jgi:multisubunit Na+/H+ antiporter MnhC subunit
MKFDRIFLIAFNALVRPLGVLAILAGFMFSMSAYAIKENRLMDILVGLFIVAVGIALLAVKSVNSDQLARMRHQMGRSGSSDRGK